MSVWDFEVRESGLVDDVDDEDDHAGEDDGHGEQCADDGEDPDVWFGGSYAARELGILGHGG